MKSKPVSSNSNNQTISHNICFSFAYVLNGCGKSKNKNFFFTNQVPRSEIKKYRTKIENSFRDWSTKPIKKLESERICYAVRKEKIDKTRDNLAKVFQTKQYSTE
jgi:hypothetical protein